MQLCMKRRKATRNASDNSVNILHLVKRVFHILFAIVYFGFPARHSGRKLRLMDRPLRRPSTSLIPQLHNERQDSRNENMRGAAVNRLADEGRICMGASGNC